MEIIYLYAIIASSFNGNLKHNNGSQLFEHCVCLKAKVFWRNHRKLNQLCAQFGNPSPKKMFLEKNRLGNDSESSRHSFASIMSRSLTILRFPRTIVIERVIAPIWLWKFTFHFFDCYIFWLRPNIGTQLPSNWTVQGFKMISHRMPLRYESFKVNPD